MTVALVSGQHAFGHSATGIASLSVSFPNPVTPGNSVFVYSATYNYDPGATEITDNQTGNTYTRDIASATHATNAAGSALYHCPVVGATGTFTVKQTYTGSQIGDLFIAEFSGVATTSPVDGTPATNRVTGNSWTGPSSGAITAGDLVLTATAPTGSSNPEGCTQTVSGWTLLDKDDDGTQFVVSQWSYQVVSAGTAVNGAWTTNNTNITLPSVIAAYKASAGAAVTPVKSMISPNIAAVQRSYNW